MTQQLACRNRREGFIDDGYQEPRRIQGKYREASRDTLRARRGCPPEWQERIMKEVVTALLVYDTKEPFAALQGVLERQAVQTTRAQTCEEAVEILQTGTTPHLIFTDAVLPDGTWERVLALASKSPEFVNVIVVSALPDIRLYIETVERGAWDFVAPPFAEIEVAHVVRCAVENVHKRRTALAQLYATLENTAQARRAVWTGWGV
jgi:DNA-binding NtrC family response regulator